VLGGIPSPHPEHLVPYFLHHKHTGSLQAAILDYSWGCVDKDKTATKRFITHIE
jgi:hypothetical protein